MLGREEKENHRPPPFKETVWKERTDRLTRKAVRNGLHKAENVGQNGL